MVLVLLVDEQLLQTKTFPYTYHVPGFISSSLNPVSLRLQVKVTRHGIITHISNFPNLECETLYILSISHPEVA